MASFSHQQLASIVSPGHQQASTTPFYPWNCKHPSKLLHCLSLQSPETAETDFFFLKKRQVSAFCQGKFKSSTADILRRKQSSPGLSLQHKRQFHLVGSVCSGSLVPSCWMGRGEYNIKRKQCQACKHYGQNQPLQLLLPLCIGLFTAVCPL